MSAPTPDLLTTLLREVSRSFYLTLRLLPVQVRPQIGLAYLLARATDTVADTGLIPVADRLAALEALRERILGNRPGPVDFRNFADCQALPAERELLRRIEEAVSVLQGFDCFDRCCIREVIATITSGQALDLQRFADGDARRVTALATDAALDDYTYRVAGCVGGFWTRICRSHLYPQASLDLPRYLEDAVQFGQGLQLVNILRDLPEDLRKGRCYLSEEGLARQGLTPEDLRHADRSEVAERFRPEYRRHLEVAARRLAAGWRYTCATPRQQRRIRMACALPLLIGADTLRLLAARDVLRAPARLKISRHRVRWRLVQTIALQPFPACWERLFRADLPALAQAG